MSRSVRRAAVSAACLAGLLMTAGPAGADAATVQRAFSCGQGAGIAWSADRGCRSVAHRRTFRPAFARVRAPAYLADAAGAYAARYVSLLILGVGY